MISNNLAPKNEQSHMSAVASCNNVANVKSKTPVFIFGGFPLTPKQGNSSKVKNKASAHKKPSNSGRKEKIDNSKANLKKNVEEALQKINQRANEDAALAQNVLDNVSACSKFLCTGVYSLLAEFTGIVVSVVSCVLKFGLVMPVVEFMRLIAECGKVIAKSAQKFAQYMKKLAQKFAKNVQNLVKEGIKKCPSWGNAIKTFVSQHQIAMLELLNIAIMMISVYFGVAGGYIRIK